ncbi:glutathione S-transferase family protein [Rhizobium sp. CCGE 510]|uniref:glutathione S-transferase family protein n=1 Tax=Rhizobium sp. CCGE 510 TaxID=1132836 RepID=UPI00027B8170|nr:glutathione S-transferase family protein [Rhizobium sp. CCGE 510]EJT04247.1 glutathione S-transferase [Rhizobium sp. CCGE 510]
MYKLYCVPDWSSLAVRMVLEELGEPYEAILVDNDKAERDTPAFRSMSPLGLIPALETPDGVMIETTAILLWLADRHGRLAPPPSSPERAAFLKWLLFTNNTVHTLILHLFHPERVSSEDATSATLALARRQMEEVLGILDAMVQEERPSWLVGPQPSILNFYLAMLMRWMNGYEQGHPAHIRSQSYPSLHQVLVTLEMRPAAIRAARVEGLGETFFTSPTLI